MKTDALIVQLEQIEASIRAKVEHPLRRIKRQFGHLKAALPRAAEQRRATDEAVRAVEPVDGAQETADTGWTNPTKAAHAKSERMRSVSGPNRIPGTRRGTQKLRLRKIPTGPMRIQASFSDNL